MIDDHFEVFRHVHDILLLKSKITIEDLLKNDSIPVAFLKA